VRRIEFSKIVETVESLCINAAYELPADVLSALQTAAGSESSPSAVKILQQLVENARLASAERIPLCQDTGLAVVFVEQGSNAVITCPAEKTPLDAINEGVAAGYEKGLLRKSIVAEPLNQRKNTGTNAPACVHWSFVPGEKLRITFMAKGGGCENKSAFKMFGPTAGVDEITGWVIDVIKSAGADACPPFIVGLGVGGSFEQSCLLSKKALIRKLDQPNPDSFYAGLEAELLSRINRLGIGPQGLGGDTTALAVLLETAPCHIASLPVAVNIECHSHRHCEIVI
jgi:fumarate hydratase subunit alpha